MAGRFSATPFCIFIISAKFFDVKTIFLGNTKSIESLRETGLGCLHIDGWCPCDRGQRKIQERDGFFRLVLVFFFFLW